jgi:hypothetical protein
MKQTLLYENTSVVCRDRAKSLRCWFGHQSATERQLEKFVRQLCESPNLPMKDGLAVRICNVRK